MHHVAPRPHDPPTLPSYRDFVTTRLIPLEHRFLLEDFEAVVEDLDRLRGEAKARGLWAPQLPTELGGAGLSLVGLAAVGRALGASLLGHYACNCQAPDSGNLELLLEYGTPEQKQRYLEPLAAGAIRSCFAMTEPARPGSNPVWMDATARREGDEYVIDGEKWFTSSADGAAFAVVMAVTDPEAPRHRRASLFLVPTDTPGYRLVENVSVMGERGGGWASHARVAFEACRVPLAARLAAEGEGFALAQARLGPGRIHHCMRWIGIADRALDLLCRQAVARELKPGHVLADEPVVQSWIARSRAEIDAAALLVESVAEEIEARGDRAARDRVSMIKYHVAGMLQRVLDRSIQAHGALGLTDYTPLAYWWRHERGARIYDGPDEVHERVVARTTLAPYRSAP